MTLRIGTRASALAMAQTGQVADRLVRESGETVELVKVTTAGDRSTASLASLGGTGVFAAALRRLDWQALFIDGRDRFRTHVAVRIVGHGVFEKLLAPYKALCAHAWVIDAASAVAPGEPDDALDACCAASLQPQALSAASLCPLPLLGVPGWWPASEDPRFYADRAVFRTSRRTR